MSTRPNYPFFVYGTLLPDQPNHYLLKDFVYSVQPATFANGRLYDLGRFPMLVEVNEPSVVLGALITVAPEATPLARARLDQLEGYDPAEPHASVYRRVLRPVTVADAELETAWVYTGSPPATSGQQRIRCGHWPTHLRQKRAEIYACWAAAHPIAAQRTPHFAAAYAKPLEHEMG